ncbi:SGNH/GDSL hydrolase family protein [Pedobacter sp. ASV1-7]|jgi:lysophospholipase L1-like esterase|uniref:SGNH/GDSL hydrolase family protein n=1 Tax=Pedobacter sp. ASV1-7 TaxID=3145237 RepID=UPI0032E86E80
MTEQNNTSDRRSFLKKISLAGAMTLGIPEIVSAALITEKKADKVSLRANDIILFQGDSITDAKRKRTDLIFNSAQGMGSGYAFLAASELLSKHFNKDLKIYNRGVGGDKVYQLADRWEEDCMKLKPTVLSIHVGVNDHWHVKSKGYTGTIKTYRDDFKNLLDRTKQKNPDVRLIIGEPFGVAGIKGNYEVWDPAFKEFRVAAKEIADQYSAFFIPYQKVYDMAQKQAPGIYWTWDGVHPTMAGAQLMAQAWLTSIKG